MDLIWKRRRRRKEKNTLIKDDRDRYEWTRNDGGGKKKGEHTESEKQIDPTESSFSPTNTCPITSCLHFYRFVTHLLLPRRHSHLETPPHWVHCRLRSARTTNGQFNSIWWPSLLLLGGNAQRGKDHVVLWLSNDDEIIRKRTNAMPEFRMTQNGCAFCGGALENFLLLPRTEVGEKVIKSTLSFYVVFVHEIIIKSSNCMARSPSHLLGGTWAHHEWTIFLLVLLLIKSATDNYGDPK